MQNDLLAMDKHLREAQEYANKQAINPSWSASYMFHVCMNLIILPARLPLAGCFGCPIFSSSLRERETLGVRLHGEETPFPNYPDGQCSC